MFGITPQPQRTTNGRVTSNAKEEIRHGGNSSTYDTAASERMKMDYLKKERERREKERNKMIYDGKKRDYDRLVQESERMKTESHRLESELQKYTHDVEGIKMQGARETAGVPALKKEELELVQKIQKMESDLLSFKNRHQRIVQELLQISQKDKSTLVDLHKREAYTAGIKSKYETIKAKYEETVKQAEKLHVEVDQLKRLIV
jgi:chromosome segregation ATPase